MHNVVHINSKLKVQSALHARHIQEKMRQEIEGWLAIYAPSAILKLEIFSDLQCSQEHGGHVDYMPMQTPMLSVQLKDSLLKLIFYYDHIQLFGYGEAAQEMIRQIIGRTWKDFTIQQSAGV